MFFCSSSVPQEEGVADQSTVEDIETVEYAISQVVGGGEGSEVSINLDTSGNIAELVKSTLVTISEPIEETQRQAIIKFAQEHSVSQAAEKFNITSSIVEELMATNSTTSCGSSSEEASQTKSNSPSQGRKLSYSQKLDDTIAAHVKEVLAQGKAMTKQEMCQYAKRVIQEENPDFTASAGWAQRFVSRHNIELSKPPKRKPPPTPETRGRPLTYSTETDKSIASYVRNRLSEGQVMTNSELRKYAKEAISKENPNFTGSASWAQNFLLRHRIALQGSVVDTVSAPPLSSSSTSSSAGSLLSQAHLSSSPTMSMASMSSSLTDNPLGGPAAEITPTSSASVYGDIPTSGSMEVSMMDESMKTALAILSAENIDSAALQSSLSELTSDPVSLMGLLSNAQQLQDGSGEGGVALITHGLESPSGNIYLGLGVGGSEGFGGGLSMPSLSTQVDPTTQTTPITSLSRPSTSREGVQEAIAQASRPLSYTKETDQALANWVQEQQAAGKKVTFASLRTYAKKLISSENPSFNASVGWVTPFLLRHNLDLNINKKQTRKANNPRKISSEEAKEGELEEMGDGEPQLQTADPPTISPEVLVTAIATSLAEHAQSSTAASQLEQVLVAAGAQALQQQQQRQLQEQGAGPEGQGEEQINVDVTSDPTPVTGGEPTSTSVNQENVTGESVGGQRTGEVLPATGTAVTVVDVGDAKEEKKPMPKSWRKEKSRRRHTLAEKLEVVQLMKERNLAAHHVCRMLGIANSTFAGWTKLVQQKRNELEALSTNKKRANVSGQGRPLSYAKEKDEQIAEWVRCQQALGIQVTPAELSKRATAVISDENSTFTASSGWQQKFLQRHNLQLTTSWGHKSSSPVATTSSATSESKEVPVPVPVPEQSTTTQEIEDPGNIPAAVQTEEVISNDITSDKPFSDEIDEQLAKWTRDQVRENGSLAVQTFCKQMETMVHDENPSSQFIATLGCAFRFLYRHNIFLDPKPAVTLLDSSSSSRKRSYSMASTPDQSLLATPKKLNLSEDMTVSPSTGNLCEALLALSNQSGEGEASNQSIQAAVQTIQQALQQQQAFQALQQRQQQMSQQQLPSPSSQQQQQQSVKMDGQDETAAIAGLAMTPGSLTNTYFGKPAREFTAEEKEEVVRYANATTLQKAALKYGVAAPTVWRWRVELKLHQPKYTSMQKKYIIKFAETNSLKEAAQRYGITGKTIQNWRRALQSEGELPSGAISEDPANIPEPVEPMDLAPPTTGGADEAGSSEVVTYDNQNFQFIVDGGEVIDTGGGRGEQGGRGSVVNLPLEVTTEVDIENVGMEYDVVSTEGHAAKPRCTPEEKNLILKYALDHSVREASQKFGVSPGTLYYWKKSASSSSNSTGASTGATPTPTTITASKVGGDKSTLTSTTGNESVLVQYAGVAGDSNVLKLLGGHPGVSSDPVTVSPEQFIATSSVALAGLQSALPPDNLFLQAVSSMLSSSADNEGGEQRKSRRHDSTSEGICSPTEVLVQPFQTTQANTATTDGSAEEEQGSEDKQPLTSETAVLSEDVENVVEVSDNTNEQPDEGAPLKIEEVRSIEGSEIASQGEGDVTISDPTNVTSTDDTTETSNMAETIETSGMGENIETSGVIETSDMGETIETVVEDISQTVELRDDTSPADSSEPTVQLSEVTTVNLSATDS